MKKELQDKLFEKYPKIFRQKDLDKTQTCMCWGIECGDGWFALIDELCNNLQSHIDNDKLQQIEAVQVKEKWGGLRFYTNNTNSIQLAIINFAESLSYKICEQCSSMDDVSLTQTSWKRSLCKKCIEIDNKGVNNG